MSIWTDSQISRFAAEAEREISLRVKCITKRVALNVRRFNSVYDVPADVISLRRVTWRGKKLDPKPMRGLLEYPLIYPAGVLGAFDSDGFSDGFYVSASYSLPTGQVPYAYFYSGYGENVIKLFPTPSEDLPALSTDLFGANIPNCCILEYYAFADVTGNTYRIPPYIGRRLVKAFVLFKCYSVEGIGQDLEAAARFKARFEQGIAWFTLVNDGVFVAKMRTRSPEGNYFTTKIGRPRLPSNFGTLVND